MSTRDKLQEELANAIARRNAIWNDLKEHGATLSAPSQVILIGEIAIIDNQINQLKHELEEMGWQEFMQAAWDGLDNE